MTQATPQFENLRVQVEITTKCNLRCKMCIRADTIKQRVLGNMSMDVFHKVVDQAPPGARFCLQGTGEPFLHPEFFEMVRLCKERGFYVETYTNGTRLDPEKIVASGLDLIVLSVLGSTAESADPRARGMRFRKVLAGWRQIAEMKKDRDLLFPTMAFNVCCMEENREELADIVRLAADTGVKYVQLTPVGDNPDLVPDRQAMDRLMPGLVALGQSLGVDVRPYKLTPGPNYRYKVCSWPWNGYYITVDGKVAPCCTRPHLESAWFAGQVETTDTVKDLWQGKEWSDFRKNLGTREFHSIPAMCRECVEWNY